MKKALRAHKGISRPLTRGDCVNGIRPCPWVSCRHHLYLDVVRGGTLVRINFPEIEPGDLKDSCSLDVAERGELNPEQIATALNLGPDAIRKAVKQARTKARLEMV